MLSLQGCTSHRSLLLSLSTKWFQTLVHKECSRHFQNTLHKKTIFSTKKSRLDKTKPRCNYNNPHSTLDGSNIIRNMPIQICWKHDDFTQFYKKNSNCLFFEAPWANSLLLKQDWKNFSVQASGQGKINFRIIEKKTWPLYKKNKIIFCNFGLV